MTLSNTLKKRFVKDTKLPIQIFDEPYFSYYLEIFDNYFDTKSKYELFKSFVNRLEGGEEEFFSLSRKITDSIIETVSNNPAYIEFNTGDMNKYKNTLSNQQKLYHPSNIGKTFVSIDLVKANFQAFRFVNPEIVNGCNSYAEFMKAFTSEDYFLNSKQIRQVIFGHLNPKRQQTVQKYLMSLLKDYLLANGVEDKFISSSTSDEIVVEVDSSFDIVKLVENRTVLTGNEFHVETFVLKKAHDLKPFYLKDFDNGKYELKGVPSYYMPQVVKHVEGKEVEEKDLYFFYEGELSKFINSLY